MKKEYCVISHTHWDREWYFTFERFRYRLVKLMDNLLEIMEKEPTYIFHLDAQTIVIEDYLKIKPYNACKIQKYIKEGRLIAGPWYVQNDFYLTDGEATIRNLLIGKAIADSFGGCGKTGYIPDQFGNISQLPQIFNSFGIKTCLLGRGYTFYDTDENGKNIRKPTPAEFFWHGKDGSKVFSVRFTHWYNNAQRFSEDADKNVKLIKHIEDAYEGTERTPYYLLMNGVDHLEAQENLLDVLPPLNQKLSDGVVVPCTMEEYCDKVQAYLHENNIQSDHYTGELRHGDDYTVLKGTLSSRVYLKTANFKAQNKIEAFVEPLCTMASLYGFDEEYKADYLEYLWKLLIENHPHDSICGCSTDGVHKNMEDRTARFNDVASELIHDALDAMSTHISRESLTDEDYIISVWNTSSKTATGLCTVECNFPVTESFNNFTILDENGKSVPFEVIRRDVFSLKTTSPINLPGEIDCDSFLIKLYAENVPAMGFKAYTVRKAEGNATVHLSEPREKENLHIENALFAIDVDEMGQIDLTHKASGKTYKNCIRLSDTGDKGSSYVYREVKECAPIETDTIKPLGVYLIKDTAFEKTVSVKYCLKLPESMDFTKWRRSEKTVENTVEIQLSLNEASNHIDIKAIVDNKSSDHRLRILFDTYMQTDFTTSLIPFDTIVRDRRDTLKKITSDGTQPNSGLVHIHENGLGIGFLNEGLYEYEHLLGDKGTVAFTLLRCTGIISERYEREKRSTMSTFDSQCIGKYQLHLGITFLQGEEKNTSSKLISSLDSFSKGLCAYFMPYSHKKFTGGRPQVQDTDIAEQFFRKDSHEGIVLPKSSSLMKFEGDSMILSAVKMSRDGKMLIIRAYNSTDDDTSFGITVNKAVKQSYVLNMAEEKLQELDGKNSVKLSVKPREIVTVGFEL